MFTLLHASLPSLLENMLVCTHIPRLYYHFVSNRIQADTLVKNVLFILLVSQ